MFQRDLNCFNSFNGRPPSKVEEKDLSILQFVQWTPPVPRTPVRTFSDHGLRVNSNLKLPKTGDFEPDGCSIPQQKVVVSNDGGLCDKSLPGARSDFSTANQDPTLSITGRGKRESSFYAVHAVREAHSERVLWERQLPILRAQPMAGRILIGDTWRRLKAKLRSMKAMV
jgi:hypothetical protein